MANITDFLKQILSARYGKDVRQAIHDSIETINDEVVNYGLEASQKAEEAAESANVAQISEKNVVELEESARICSESATQSASEALNSAELAAESCLDAKSYTHGGTGTREGEDTDNAKYYADQAKKISQGLNGLVPMGTVTFANLPTEDIVNNAMYNVSDAFTSDERFNDGGGVYYGPGNNVIWTAEGKWDVTASSNVTGIKGAKETTYRQGNVNITPENIGAATEEEFADMKALMGAEDISHIAGGTVTGAVSQIFDSTNDLLDMKELVVGDTDISKIGDGTLTGGLVATNESLATCMPSYIGGNGVSTLNDFVTTVMAKSTSTRSSSGNIKINSDIGLGVTGWIRYIAFWQNAHTNTSYDIQLEMFYCIGDGFRYALISGTSGNFKLTTCYKLDNRYALTSDLADFALLTGYDNSVVYEDIPSMVLGVHNSLSNGQSVCKGFSYGTNSALVVGQRHKASRGRYLVMPRTNVVVYVYQVKDDLAFNERTIATTDDLANYLPLTGGTIYGDITMSSPWRGMYFELSNGDNVRFIPGDSKKHFEVIYVNSQGQYVKTVMQVKPNDEQTDITTRFVGNADTASRAPRLGFSDTITDTLNVRTHTGTPMSNDGGLFVRGDYDDGCLSFGIDGRGTLPVAYAKKADTDASGNNIASTYATKTELAQNNKWIASASEFTTFINSLPLTNGHSIVSVGCVETVTSLLTNGNYSAQSLGTFQVSSGHVFFILSIGSGYAIVTGSYTRSSGTVSNLYKQELTKIV